MELGKVPPHDTEAEQAVIGSMLTDKDAIISAVEILKEDLKLLKKDKFVKDLFEDINYDNVSNDIKSQSMPSRKCEGKIFQNSKFA